MSDLALVEHDLFDRELLQACADEIPDPSDTRWRRYSNAQEMKLEGPATMWGPSTVEYFRQLADMADRFGELFDIDGLTLETIGGGYHLIPPGGYLDVHTDFSKSPSTGHYHAPRHGPRSADRRRHSRQSCRGSRPTPTANRPHLARSLSVSPVRPAPWCSHPARPRPGPRRRLARSR
jgi:hypothetical protein